MIFANTELKYAQCDFFGQERRSFIQYDFDKEHLVCKDCLYNEYHD